MAYPKDEDQSNVYSGFLPQNAPLSTSPSLADFKKTDLRYKRNIRILRFLSRVVSLILSAFMTGCLSYALAKYFLTRNHIIPGNAQPWPTPTTLWPSIMLLAISAVTMIMNLVTVCSYICGIDTANKTDRSATYVRYIMLALQVVAWAIGTGLFKMANTGHDLWGYSCSGSADAIQEQVQSFLDFGKLCTTQTYTWYTSIVQAGSYLLTFIILLLVLKRSSRKKKMARKMDNMPIGMERGGDIELEPEYRAGAGRQYMPVATGPTDL